MRCRSALASGIGQRIDCRQTGTAEAAMAERFVLRNGIVLPMAGDRVVYDPGSVLVDGDRIVAVGPAGEVDGRAQGAAVVDATGHAVIPGLHNAHLHSGLLRGTAEGKTLFDWLRCYVDPAHRALTPEIAEAASMLAYTEGLRFGTTSVMDMWRYLEGAARAAEAVGVRAALVPYLADEDGYDYFESMDSTRRLLAAYGPGAGRRVRAWVGLEHLFYCKPQTVTAAAALAAEYGTGLHTHSSEMSWEVEESLRRYGCRPVQRFAALGALGPRTVIAHCVWLDDREIELLAASGTGVVHCPCSNMKLSSGAAPLRALRAAGLPVGLGTDGEKENNNLDLIEEMKFAALLEKVSTLDPTTGDPWDVLAMATLEGARVLGLAEVTGSLEPGKRADLVTVELRAPHLTPLLHGADANVAAHLVFAASGHDVDQVWVDGRLLVERGRVLSVDAETVRRSAQAAAEELFARRAALAPT
jgi:5-methylthioadenosine/S-adenosylhomocysteine deaminase